MSVSAKDHQKQGIVSILGSDNCEMMRNKEASLRRTLSADMSSKKWLAQNGFHPMKKIASSEELVAISSTSSENEDEHEGNDKNRPGQDEVWRSIQSRKEKNNDDDDDEKTQEVWTFGSILIQKNEEESPSNDLLIQPPYIHPLVKTSTNSLSKKSLEICTESLGSETGSDGFSSYPSSEAGGDEGEERQQHQHQQSQISRSFDEESQFVKYNTRKMPPRAFPPPLPSLSRDDGASLHMHCHRQGDRLVLEAVSVPSQNYFHAQRQDGRLLLTLVNNLSSQEARNEEMEDVDEVEEYAQVFDNIEEIYGNESESEDEIEDEEEEEVEKYEEENNVLEMEILEQKAKLPSGHVINVHKSALMRKKLMTLGNKNLTWSPKFNKAVNFIGCLDHEEEVAAVEEDELTQLPQSLPPLPRVARLASVGPPATAASFNAYEYFWREKPSMASMMKPTIQQEGKISLLKNNHNKTIVGSNLKGVEHLVPLLNRCNEPRRSLFWEPHCIATS